MAERKEFFEVSLNLGVLVEHSLDQDPTFRWAAAVELGELGTEDAIEILVRLSEDRDENVSEAANAALKNCDPTTVSNVFQRQKKVFEVEIEPEFNESLAEPIYWKIKPLKVPTYENQWLTDAAIIEIVKTEAPIAGARLLRLYGSAVYPNAPKKLPKSIVIDSIKRLVSRKAISKITDKNAREIENWTLTIYGDQPIYARKRGLRKLEEIPPIEVIALLKKEFGDEYDNASQDRKFAKIVESYEIKQAEYHIIGALMENEWISLFK